MVTFLLRKKVTQKSIDKYCLEVPKKSKYTRLNLLHICSFCLTIYRYPLRERGIFVKFFP